MDNYYEGEAYNDTEDTNEFQITTAQEAEWAIKQIKEKRNERDFYIDVCEKEIELLAEKIEKAKKRCDDGCNYLLFKLNEYLDSDGVPSKTTKTQKSLKLPSGRIVRKLAKREIVDDKGRVGAKIKDNEELINLIGEDFIETKKTIKWGDFKKTLTITDDGDVVTQDGEYLDCLTTREVPPSIDIVIDKE